MSSQKRVSGNQPLGSWKIRAPEENACTAFAHLRMQTTSFLKKDVKKNICNLVLSRSRSIFGEYFELIFSGKREGTKGVMRRGEKACALRSFPSSPSRASRLSPALACSPLSLGKACGGGSNPARIYKICTCSFLQYHPWCFLPSQQWLSAKEKFLNELQSKLSKGTAW